MMKKYSLPILFILATSFCGSSCRPSPDGGCHDYDPATGTCTEGPGSYSRARPGGEYVSGPKCVRCHEYQWKNDPCNIVGCYTDQDCVARCTEFLCDQPGQDCFLNNLFGAIGAGIGASKGR